MHRPFEVEQLLDMPKSTLTRRTRRYGPWLSPGSQESLTPSGAKAPRFYTDRDVALLREINARLESGATPEDIVLHLERGEFEPSVVVHDNTGPQDRADAAATGVHDTSRPATAAGSALAVQPNPGLQLLMATLDDLRDTLAAEAQARSEQHQAVQAAVQRQTEVMERQIAVQQRLLAAMEGQGARPEPLVPILEPVRDPAPETAWERLKRWIGGR